MPAPELRVEVTFPDVEFEWVRAERLERLLDDRDDSASRASAAAFCLGLVLSTLLSGGVPREAWQLLLLGAAGFGFAIFGLSLLAGRGSRKERRKALLSSVVRFSTQRFTAASTGRLYVPDPSDMTSTASSEEPTPVPGVTAESDPLT